MDAKMPEEIALLIKRIYDREFGGKNRGRFKIARSTLRQLAQRRRLDDIAIEEIKDAALELGFIMADLGDYFAVVDHKVMMNYRPVPKSILREFMHADELSGTDEDED